MYDMFSYASQVEEARKSYKLNLEYEQNEEMVDMCKAMEDYTLQQKVIGSIETMRELGMSDDKIISIVKKLFDVSDDYVLALLTPQTT